MLALVVAAGGWGTLGCNDVRKAAQDIAREDPAGVSPPSDAKPGDGAGKPKAADPPPAMKGAKNDAPDAPVAPEDAAEPSMDDGEPADGVKEPTSSRRAVTSARGRRRRPAPTGGPSAQGDLGDKGDRGDSAEGDEGDDPPSAVVAADLKVTRLVVSRAVRGREPVGVGTSFAAQDSDRMYAFVELSNEARATSEIVVTFTPPGGGAPQRIRLDVGAERRWRTWALTRKARAPGTWKVAVSDAEGAVLARSTFRITK